MPEERVLRTPLPLDLIRRIDDLILRKVGGYETRAELVREAVEAYVLELSYEPAEDASPETKPLSPSVALVLPKESNGSRSKKAGPDLGGTALRVPGAMRWSDEKGIAAENEPLFGLHNRDYPSLWAATELAKQTVDGAVVVGEFLRKVLDSAWEFARNLAPLESSVDYKLTSLFPTNRSKPQSAEGAFRLFAIGGWNSDEGTTKTSGPLFLWRVAQLHEHEGDLLISLTSQGAQLLASLDGLSLELPHLQHEASTFFAHLRTHAAADWWGFRTLIAAVRVQPTRTELIDVFGRARSDWSANEISTNAAGYIARAREWGLVEPKMIEGRYRLTAFGEAIADEESAVPMAGRVQPELGGNG